MLGVLPNIAKYRPYLPCGATKENFQTLAELQSGLAAVYHGGASHTFVLYLLDFPPQSAGPSEEKTFVTA